jgi:DNA-binding response OmpR family regulator
MNGRVVLVDGIEDEQELYGAALRRAGFTVSFCDDVATATATAARPDVVAIVARVIQPHSTLTGVDLTRAVRRSDRAAQPAIVLITTRIEPEYRHAAFAAGCDAYVLLPAPPDVIVRTVRSVIRSASHSRRRRRRGAVSRRRAAARHVASPR